MSKDYARTFGQDLMRGEHHVGGKPSKAASLPGKQGGELLIDAYRGRTGSDSDTTSASGTSVFDPVLCELVYRWFCPAAGATILDPFAGGSVRGIVAAWLGYRYVGIELRPEQVEANRAQWPGIEAQATDLGELAATINAAPTWIEGDSTQLDTLVPDVAADLVFSCPPYADLEVYSDDPRDLSTMDYPQFLEMYRTIITKAVATLKDDRFACFVVGDVRDDKGFYRNFVAETIDAFRAAGVGLYNEAVLITAIGSLPIRVGKQFNSGRKLGKTHQNVLVFYKGDPKHIKGIYGELDLSLPDEPVT